MNIKNKKRICFKRIYSHSLYKNNQIPQETKSSCTNKCYSKLNLKKQNIKI